MDSCPPPGLVAAAGFSLSVDKKYSRVGQELPRRAQQFLIANPNSSTDSD